LIGQNIMIESVTPKNEEYVIEGQTYMVNNHGIRAVIIDFGFSRIRTRPPNEKIKLYQTHRLYVPDLFADEDDKFNSTADICKIYCNPNFSLPEFNDVIIMKRIGREYRLSDLLKQCRRTSHANVAIPPFPEITARDIITSTLFRDILGRI